jgi:SAM-dependent methyltransferase
MPSAAEQWREELAAWQIDDEILAAAPETPYSFPPALFRPEARGSASPLLATARAALPAGGTVLDVGCGGGAASVPLVPPAATLVGVDEAASMLAEFSASAGAAGASVRTVQGSWPDLAADVPVADVVVCAHVAYNVGGLGPFASALTTHARHLVVLELHAEHPWVPLGPLWQRVHHQPRPDGPTSDLALAVLRDAGIDPTVEEWVRPAPDLNAPEVHEALVAFTRRRLCLTPDRDPEVAALLAEFPPPARRSVVMSWRP